MSCGEGAFLWFLRTREVEHWARVIQRVSSKGSSQSEPWWGPCLEEEAPMFPKRVKEPGVVMVVGVLALRVGMLTRVGEMGSERVLLELQVPCLSLLPSDFLLNQGSSTSRSGGG